MAAALECWSSRASTDEDIVEQVLVETQHRSDPLRATSSASVGLAKDSSSPVQKRLHKLGRNVSEAIASIKSSLSLDSVRGPPATRKVVWGGVVENLTHLYPGSQLPEKLISNIRRHFDSLPLSYAQADFDMKDVFLHVRLIEQAEIEDQPAILIQQVSDSDDETQGSVLKLTFACNCSISWQSVSEALDNTAFRCKKMQIFEKKGFTLGVILVQVQPGREKFFKNRVETALKPAHRRSKASTVKLPFGFCGCQEETSFRGRDIISEIDYENDQVLNHENITENSNNTKVKLETPLPVSSFEVSVDEWQTIRSGGDEIAKWILNSEQIEFTDQVGPNSFKGVYKGKRVAIERLRGCEKGSAYEFELRRDLLELMSCGHKNILQFCGVCIDESHGLCAVTKMMEGGTVHEIIQKRKKLQSKEIIRIAIDVAEGIKFMNEHGVLYRDLNSQRILLDRLGNACIGDMGIVSVCRSNGEVTEYETDGYRWLAPEIIAGDPESVAETWMSNVYSFGMVVWEMVTGEAAYAAYSPVQAAVGIAACGLRPEIPKDCPPVIRSLMMKCWNSIPSKRPQFSEILNLLLLSNNNNR